ncbi:hypothetical protein CEXT_614901 [Caerostris extrusa]|uniref:Uncharacterized protein n=1 Tax=Caerostris extrusa TaxID=172846 RepID=A0AAV4NM50_CAEEX|nr:hypothetical protein CEXT_614901 [Caerostris extrusa]
MTDLTSLGLESGGIGTEINNGARKTKDLYYKILPTLTERILTNDFLQIRIGCQRHFDFPSLSGHFISATHTRAACQQLIAGEH